MFTSSITIIIYSKLDQSLLQLMEGARDFPVLHIPPGVAGEVGHVVAVVYHEAVGSPQPTDTAVGQPVDAIQRCSIAKVEISWKGRGSVVGETLDHVMVM